MPANRASQNSLSEFYGMADFVNLGILGDLLTFKRVCLSAIDTGSEKDCMPQLAASVGQVAAAGPREDTRAVCRSAHL
jgi:hypothetical protein